MKKLLFNKALRLLLSTNAMILMAAAMLGPIYALFVERVGGDLMDASIAGSIFAFVAGTTALVSGKYSDKIKKKERVITFGYTVMGIGFLLLFWVNSVLFLFLVQAIIGLGEAIYAPAFDAAYSEHLDGHKEGVEWGTWESMNYFIASIGAIIGGTLVTFYGFQTLFVIMAMLCFGSAFCVQLFKRNMA